MKQDREGRILVVNDNSTQLELMSVLLAKAGFIPISAGCGSEALEVAARERPELIISDVTMPGFDGIELCRRLRADRRLRAVPVLLVSAQRTDPASVVLGLRAGADDYLEAPYDPMKFIARVSRLVERKRAAEQALRDSNAQITNILESITDAFFALDREWQFTYLNAEAAR